MTQPSRNGERNGAPSQVRFIPLSYTTDSRESAMRLILAVRPDWAEDADNVELVRCTDGITNTLLKVIYQRGGLSKDQMDEDAVLLRAYGSGTDIIIDRQQEAENHELLMKHGLAPELLARFKNGMLYRYIAGRVTSPDDLRQPPIYKAVAKRLAEWHATVPCRPVSSPVTDVTKAVNGHGNGHTKGPGHVDSVAPGKPSPNIWTVMQKWILVLPAKTDSQREQQAILQEELRKLVHNLSQRPGLGVNSLVFAHCDLLSGNVIVEPNTDGNSEQTVSVSFIDYEYATPAPAAFDIANHFAEWGGFDCDYTVLPTRSQRLGFVQEYIRAYYKFAPCEKTPDEEAEVTTLLDEVDLYRGLPGFYWGIWALIQAVISEIDFDYASYAEKRLGEYWAWKNETEGTREATGKERPLREMRWAQA